MIKKSFTIFLVEIQILKYFFLFNFISLKYFYNYLFFGISNFLNLFKISFINKYIFFLNLF
jgi:hypothetical protein